MGIIGLRTVNETVRQAMDQSNPGGVLDVIFEPSILQTQQEGPVNREDQDEQYADFFEDVQEEMVEHTVDEDQV
jgi:hypothetical protein